MLDDMDAQISEVLNPSHVRSLTIKLRDRSLYSNMAFLPGKDLKWSFLTHFTRGNVALRLS